MYLIIFALVVLLSESASGSTVANQAEQLTYLRPGSTASPFDLLTSPDKIEYVHPQQFPNFPGNFLRQVNRLESAADWVEIMEHLASSDELLKMYVYNGSVGLFGMQATRLLFEKAEGQRAVFARALQEYETLNNKVWEAELAAMRRSFDLETSLASALRYSLTSFGLHGFRIFMRNAADRGDLVSAAYMGNWLTQHPVLLKSLGAPFEQLIAVACRKTNNQACLIKLAQPTEEAQLPIVAKDLNTHLWQARPTLEPVEEISLSAARYEAVDYNFEQEQLLVFADDDRIERIDLKSFEPVTEFRLAEDLFACDNLEYHYTNRARFIDDGKFLFFESVCEGTESVVVLERRLDGWRKIFHEPGRVGILDAKVPGASIDKFIILLGEKLAQMSFDDQTLDIQDLHITLPDLDFLYSVSSDRKYAAIKYQTSNYWRPGLLLIDTETGAPIWRKEAFARDGQIEFGNDAVLLYDDDDAVLSRLSYDTFREQFLDLPQLPGKKNIVLINGSLWISVTDNHEHSVYSLSLDQTGFVNFDKPFSPALVVEHGNLIMFNQYYADRHATESTASFCQVQDRTIIELTPSKFTTNNLHVEVSADKSKFFIQQKNVGQLYTNPVHPLIEHGRLSKLQILKQVRGEL